MANAYPPTVVRTEVDGKKVVKDEVLRSNLPAGPDGLPPPMKTTRVLTLEDGTVVYGCADCPTIGATRGEVRKHRNAEHGMSNPTRRSPTSAPESTPQLPYPGPEMLGMTLLELLELSAAVAHWEHLFATQDGEIERLRKLLTDKDQELSERTRELRAERITHERLKVRISKLIGVDDKPEEKP